MKVKNKKKNPNKECSLSNEDLAELSFYTRRLKEIEIDMYLWKDALSRIKNGITSRLAVRENEVVNWDHVFIDGRVTIAKIELPPQPPTPEKPKEEVKEQEVKKDGAK